MDEHHGDSGDDARHGQGEDDPGKYMPAAAPQILCRLNEQGVDLHDDGVKGQDHIGQVVVHHAQNHCACGADEGQGADAEQPQELVDDAGIPQQAHPGQGPQEEAHTHGQHDQQVQKPLHPRPLPGDEIGDRIADDQTDERRNQGVPHRAQEDPGKGAGEDLGQIVQRKQTGGRISQSVEHHNAQGNQDKDGHPDDIGDGEEEGPPGPPARGGFRVILLHLRHPPSVRRILRNRSCSRRIGRSTRSWA